MDDGGPARWERVVRVLHADGRPAVGAEVRVAPVLPRDEPVATVFTDDGGLARFRSQNPVHVLATWRDTHAATGICACRGPTELHLEPAVPVRGRVVAADGSPVAGALCEVHWRTPERSDHYPGTALLATTGTDGRFVLPAVPSSVLQVAVALRTTASGFVRTFEPVVAGDGPPGEIEVRLERGRAVTGRCVDEGGVARRPGERRHARGVRALGRRRTLHAGRRAALGDPAHGRFGPASVGRAGSC